MATQNIDADTTRSMMTLAGGALALIAAASTIVHARLQKARSAEARDKVITIAFGATMLFLTVSGLVFALGFDAPRPALWLWGFSTLVFVIEFSRRPGPFTRFEAAMLTISVSCFTAAVMGFFLLGITSQVNEQLTRLINALAKH